MTKTVFKWVEMAAYHLSSVKEISEQIHINYPEDEAIAKERLALYPKGCRVLMAHDKGVGYMISHPIVYGNFPKLNTMLVSIPHSSETYYIHDIALLPAYQNLRLAKQGVEAIISHARNNGFKEIYLIAVNGTKPYWERQGFEVNSDEKFKKILQTYDEEAILMCSNFEKS